MRKGCCCLREIKALTDSINNYGSKPYAKSQLKKLNQELEKLRAKKNPVKKNKNNPFPIAKKIRTPKLSIVKKERIKQERVGDDFFLAIPRGVIRNDAYRQLFKGPGTVYEYLWANIVRGHMNNDKFNILDNYYKQGLLAYATSLRHIGDKCSYDKNTVNRIVTEFCKAGVLLIDPIYSGKGREPQNVYILGTWSEVEGKKPEDLFINHIYKDKKAVNISPVGGE